MKKAVNIRGRMPKPQLPLDYHSFTGLIKAWFRKIIFRERDIQILEHRLAVADNIEFTLHECGAMFNMTRERARQLLEECYQEIHKPKALDVIKPFWDACTLALEQAGGALSLEELWDLLKKQYHWKEPLPNVAFQNILGLNGIKPFGPDAVFLPGQECLTSAKIRTEILHFTKENPETPLPEAQKILWDRCKKIPKGKAVRFSVMTLTYLCETTKPMTERTRIDGNTLYDLDRWQIRHGYFKDALVSILKLAGKPMHCNDLHAELAKWRKKNVTYRVLRYFMAVLPETRLVYTSVYAYQKPEKEEVFEDQEEN
jgi:hypothetical protein